jgi:hypothetical protein
MRRIIILMALLVMSLPTAVALAAPVPLSSFDALMVALRAGAHVRVVIDYGKCKLISDNAEDEAPDAVGGMDLATFEYFGANAVGNPDAFVVFSETSLIQHPKRGYVYNHVKVRVQANGEVLVEARYLDVIKYEVTMEEKFFTRIADDKEGAARFFRVD